MFERRRRRKGCQIRRLRTVSADGGLFTHPLLTYLMFEYMLRFKDDDAFDVHLQSDEFQNLVENSDFLQSPPGWCLVWLPSSLKQHILINYCFQKSFSSGTLSILIESLFSLCFRLFLVHLMSCQDSFPLPMPLVIF